MLSELMTEHSSWCDAVLYVWISFANVVCILFCSILQ